MHVTWLHITYGYVFFHKELSEPCVAGTAVIPLFWRTKLSFRRGVTCPGREWTQTRSL